MFRANGRICVRMDLLDIGMDGQRCLCNDADERNRFFYAWIEGNGQLLKNLQLNFNLVVFVFLVSRGIKSASFINAIATCAKVIPLILFIVVMAVSFKAGILTADFWGKVNDSAISGTYQSTSVFKQISSSLMVMVWAFYGLEGASLLSKRAEKPSDARIASIIGMIILLVIYMLISLLPYGVLSRHELASCPQPAMSCIMQKVVGTWGVIAINSGIVISTLSAWLAWTLLPGETLMILAKDEVLPKILESRTNMVLLRMRWFLALFCRRSFWYRCILLKMSMIMLIRLRLQQFSSSIFLLDWIKLNTATSTRNMGTCWSGSVSSCRRSGHFWCLDIGRHWDCSYCICQDWHFMHMREKNAENAWK